MSAEPVARRELVALFERHGALVDPELLADLEVDGDGLARVQAVLGDLAEVPFHFDAPLFLRLEEQLRERVSQPAASPVQLAPSPEAEAGRKEALRRAAAAIYDGGGPARDADEEDEAAGDHDDQLALADEAPKLSAAEEAKAFTVVPRSDWRPLAADHEGRLTIVSDMTGNSTCEGATGDFVDYFQDRYERISKMLRQRRELRNAVPIERVRPGQQEVAIIGMVGKVTTTKNGHRRIELEDSTGTLPAIVRADETQLTAMADSLVQDEVIGLTGQATNKGDLIFADGLIRPDIPRQHPREGHRGADVPLAAAFLSDIHVGSNTFLSDQWASMLRWLSGHGATRREREAAGRVKYLVMPGDLVDGIGIYPGQQDELTIGDIYDQYEAFGHWMEDLPDHLQVVIQPGNHDAARPAEPQPAFSQEVRERFDRHDTHFVANPAWFKLHGALTLGYHGFSLIDFATTVSKLDYEDPLPTMQQMLECRHMAPLYGERTPVAPEHHDYLVIDEVPDLFVTGHVHVPGLRNYRGVLNINCGTWQSQTSYQKMLNFTPDPARMPIVDLKSLRGTLVDFMTPSHAGTLSDGAGTAQETRAPSST
ncbi:MAG: DNA-directed DNA polymerase II small subunit [Thermoplasmatota archaeon]